MAEETFREFVSTNCAEFDTRNHFENKDVADLSVDNNEMNTSFT